MSGTSASGLALHERHDAARQVGGDGRCRRNRRAASATRDPVEPHRRDGTGPALAPRPNSTRPRRGPADCGRRPAQRRCDLDAVRAQLVGIADARQHQELRRVDDAAGEDHLALGARRHRSPRRCDIRRRPRGRLRARRACASASISTVEVGARQRRAQIGDRGAAAPAVADVVLAAAEAFLLRRRCSRRCAGSPAATAGLDDRRRPAGRRRVATARRAGRRRRDRRRRRPPRIPAAEIRQRMGVGPVRQAGARPSGRSRRGGRAHRPWR